MPMWRCPHCGTPQVETARCWVCRRSSTACTTCRHFRRSVAAELGYCGLDRQRRPLRGDEIRACWEATVVPADLLTRSGPRPGSGRDGAALDRTPVHRLEFVEVAVAPTRSHRRSTADGAKEAAAEAAATADMAVRSEPAVAPAEPRWSLWGDAET